MPATLPSRGERGPPVHASGASPPAGRRQHARTPHAPRFPARLAVSSPDQRPPPTAGARRRTRRSRPRSRSPAPLVRSGRTPRRASATVRRREPSPFPRGPRAGQQPRHPTSPRRAPAVRPPRPRTRSGAARRRRGVGPERRLQRAAAVVAPTPPGPWWRRPAAPDRPDRHDRAAGDRQHAQHRRRRERAPDRDSGGRCRTRCTAPGQVLTQRRRQKGGAAPRRTRTALRGPATSRARPPARTRRCATAAPTAGPARHSGPSRRARTARQARRACRGISPVLTVPPIVKIAKPMPRDHKIAYSPAPELTQISAGAGAPSTTMPSATTHGRRDATQDAGTSGRQTTVAPSIKIVVGPGGPSEATLRSGPCQQGQQRDEETSRSSTPPSASSRRPGTAPPAISHSLVDTEPPAPRPVQPHCLEGLGSTAGCSVSVGGGSAARYALVRRVRTRDQPSSRPGRSSPHQHQASRGPAAAVPATMSPLTVRQPPGTSPGSSPARCR